MNCTRQKAETHWRNVGYNCAAWGKPIEVALTKHESINALIREGYDKYARRKASRHHERLPGFLTLGW